MDRDQNNNNNNNNNNNKSHCTVAEAAELQEAPRPFSPQVTALMDTGGGG